MGTNEGASIIQKTFFKGQPLTFGKGDIILGNQAVPDGVYYISSGYVKVYSISDDGDEYLHIIYGKGELFPFTWAFLGTSPESLFYQSLADTVVWRMSRDWFVTLSTTHLPFSNALGLQLARQFQIFIDRVDNLEYKKAGERIAYRLLFLASRFGVHTDEQIAIDMPITHEVFANSINLARETVSRHIEELEKEHIIKTEKNNIIITDIPGLMDKMSRPNNINNWDL